MPIAVPGIDLDKDSCSLARLHTNGAVVLRWAQGHTVRLMSPEYMQPYAKPHKTGDCDAEAIAEAATRSIRLRAIRGIVNATLEAMSAGFDALYLPTGRGSIPPSSCCGGGCCRRSIDRSGSWSSALISICCFGGFLVLA